MGTSNFMILARLLNLKILHEFAPHDDRNFKFTALGSIQPDNVIGLIA
jgi:hypothetical protein